MEPNSVELRKDPVDRMVCDLTPRELVDWMVKYHGLPEKSAETVERNLREQYKWHRLQGRLDRGWKVFSVLAELLGMRQAASVLSTPQKKGLQVSIETERNAYKAALEEIADPEACWSGIGCAQIASSALKSTKIQGRSKAVCDGMKRLWNSQEADPV